VRNKARLVAQSYTQVEGLDFGETYHYHRTKISWWPKTAKEYRKTAKEIVIGDQPSRMNRQG
jgi:hypothetical protein